MKLRQKLAAVLAATMLATSVPVVTMAASTNTITREVVVVKEKASFTSVTTAPQVKIDFKDFDTTNGETFYLELENAEWNTIDNAGVNKLKDVDADQEWSAPAGVTVTAISKTVAKVDVAATYAVASALHIPLLTTVKTGEATVSLKKMGSHSTITEGKWVYATTSNKVAVTTVGTAPSIYTNGKIAELKFTEAFKGSIAGTANYATVELQESDFEFNLGTAVSNNYVATKDSSGKITGFTEDAASSALKYSLYQVNAAYGFGFAGHTETTVNVYVPANDGAVAVIELKGKATPDSLGVITIKELAVRATSKAPQTGELKADISGAVDTQSNVVVAKIAAYGTTLTVKDDKAVEILAGQSKDVEFTLSENVEDSIVANREVTFTLDKGYFALEGATKAESITNLKAAMSVFKHVDNGADDALKANIVDVVIKDKKVVGFEVKLPTTLVNTKIDEFTVKAKVFIGLAEEGDVTVKAAGRALIEAVETVVVSAKKAITVTSESAVVKVGLIGQKGGKITITEADKAIFKNGQKLEIALPFEKGMTFAGKPVVTVTGDVQTGDVALVDVKDALGNVIGRKVTVEVKRTSKVASTITLSDFEISTDRTLPEGKFKVELGGAAVTANGDTLEIKDFVVVGTPNTQDLAKNGLRRGVATFVIGESKYTVNGIENAMTAASYIQNPGFTMVPVRFVVEAFGVQDKDILFSNGTATIFAGERTVQLRNGSDIAIVNGVQIKMETKVVIKEGRTYAPIGEVSKLLGIDKAWDNTSKTASFENK